MILIGRASADLPVQKLDWSFSDKLPLHQFGFRVKVSGGGKAAADESPADLPDF
jgi:hypothetical protein